MGLRLVRFPSPSTLFINQTDQDGNKFIERHEELLNRGLPNCHPIIAITGLREELDQLHSEKINFGNTNTVKYDTRLNQYDEYDVLHHVVLSGSNTYDDPSKNEYVAISYPGHTYDECKAKAEEMGLILAMPKTALEWNNAFATVVDFASQRFYIGSVKRNQVVHVDNGNVTYAGNYQWLDNTNIDLAYVSNSYTSFNARSRNINTGVALSYYSGSLTTDWIFADTLLDGFIGEKTYQSTVTLDKDTKQPYTKSYPNAIIKLFDGLYVPDYKTYIDQVLSVANAKQNPIYAGTTNGIAMSFSGNTIYATPKISSRTKNIIQIMSDGFYVREFKLNLIDTNSIYQSTAIGDGLKDVYNSGTFISLKDNRTKKVNETIKITNADGREIGGYSPYYPHQYQKAEQKNGTYWYYDSSRSSFVQHSNVTQAFIGIIAKPTFSSYVHRCILTSSDSDNDLNGVILAYWESADGTECHTLSVLLSPSSDNSQSDIGKTNYAVVYDFRMPTVRGGHQILATYGNTSAGNWTPYANGGWKGKWKGRNATVPSTGQTYTRAADTTNTPHYIGVYAKKEENIITIKITDWHSSQTAVTSNGYINASTIEINLDNYSWGWMFSGRTRYGYCNLSQAESSWILQEISGSDEFGLNVRLSPDNGNILRIKDNGLFVPSPDNWSGTITDLQNTVNNHTSQITSLQNTINNHTLLLSQIEPKVDDHEVRITNNENDITKLKTYSNSVFKNSNTVYYTSRVIDSSINKKEIIHHVKLYGSKKFIVVEGSFGGYWGARQHAINNGYRLAMPKTPEEVAEVSRVIRATGYGGVDGGSQFKLGGYLSNGQWIWDDGTPIQYFNWAPGQPSGGENGLNIYPHSGQWNDYDMSINNRGYIAEIYPLPEDYDYDTNVGYTPLYPNALVKISDGLYAPDYKSLIDDALIEVRNLSYNFKDTYSTSVNRNGQDISINVKISNKVGNMIQLEEDGLYFKVPEEIEDYNELVNHVILLDERLSRVEDDYVEYEFYNQVPTEQDIIERAIEDDSSWSNWNIIDSNDIIAEDTDVLNAIEEDYNWSN